MAHKFDMTARKKLNSEERKRLLSPYETLSIVGFKKGDTMADIGCGTGLFSIPAAKLISPGTKIYAIDISQEMLDEVSSAAETEHIDNITTVKSDEYDFKLKDESADFILLCTVLHEVDDKQRLLMEANRVCLSGGTVAVIEFNETNTSFGPPLSHRLKKAEASDLLINTGFTIADEFDISEAFYAIKARKI